MALSIFRQIARSHGAGRSPDGRPAINAQLEIGGDLGQLHGDPVANGVERGAAVHADLQPLCAHFGIERLGRNEAHGQPAQQRRGVEVRAQPALGRRDFQADVRGRHGAHRAGQTEINDRTEIATNHAGRSHLSDVHRTEPLGAGDAQRDGKRVRHHAVFRQLERRGHGRATAGDRGNVADDGNDDFAHQLGGLLCFPDSSRNPGGRHGITGRLERS
jgi:hypothetical protein